MNRTPKHDYLAVLDYFFVLRPMLFFPGWATLMAGYFAARYQGQIALRGLQGAALPETAWLLIAFGAAMGASFLLNQLADIESDRLNNKLFIIAEGHISTRAAVAEILFLLVIALLIAFYFSLLTGLIVIVFILVTGWLYNYPPFNFKDKPWWSLLANSLMGWLAFSVGWTAVIPTDWALIKHSLPYLFLNTALYFYTTLPDIEGDAGSSKKTLAVLYGTDKLIWASFFLFILSLSSAAVLIDYQALFILILSAPFFLLTLGRQRVEKAVRTTKFTILFFNLIIALQAPWYFLLMAGLFFLTRWYFKARFDFDYPNFKGKG